MVNNNQKSLLGAKGEFIINQCENKINLVRKVTKLGAKICKEGVES